MSLWGFSFKWSNNGWQRDKLLTAFSWDNHRTSLALVTLSSGHWGHLEFLRVQLYVQQNIRKIDTVGQELIKSFDVWNFLCCLCSCQCKPVCYTMIGDDPACLSCAATLFWFIIITAAPLLPNGTSFSIFNWWLLHNFLKPPLWRLHDHPQPFFCVLFMQIMQGYMWSDKFVIALY